MILNVKKSAENLKNQAALDDLLGLYLGANLANINQCKASHHCLFFSEECQRKTISSRESTSLPKSKTSLEEVLVKV